MCVCVQECSPKNTGAATPQNMEKGNNMIPHPASLRRDREQERPRNDDGSIATGSGLGRLDARCVRIEILPPRRRYDWFRITGGGYRQEAQPAPWESEGKCAKDPFQHHSASFSANGRWLRDREREIVSARRKEAGTSILSALRELSRSQPEKREEKLRPNRGWFSGDLEVKYGK